MRYLTVIFIMLLINLVKTQKSFSSLPCLKQERNSRVVGGSEAEKDETPYIVSLTRRGGHFCGATVINEKWLITAAHCVCNGLNNIMKPSHIKGILGLHKISEFNSDSTSTIGDPYEVNFNNIVVHPDYKCSQVSHDIALLELKIPITFTEKVKPTCLAIDTSNEDYSGSFATVSGWGWTDEDQEKGIRPDTLQKASVKIWDNDKCQESYQTSGKKNLISNTQMCAGHESGGIDSCWADSGGPLITKSKVLVGIVSTGVGCARPGLPGIYTRVSKYIDWIDSVLN